MGKRIMLFRCRQTLRALQKANHQLTDLWSDLHGSDRAELRDLSEVFLGDDVKDQIEEVRDAQEIIRDVFDGRNS